MARTKPNADAEQDATAGWVPPAGAQSIELSEFFSFGKQGETVVGRIQRVTERPDPVHPDKIMRALVLSPAVTFVPGGKPEAFKTLAVGLSAHLGLLIDNPKGEIGNGYAIQYDGTRPAETRGKQPSKQFKVWKLTPQQFEDAVRKAAGKHADALLGGETDDLPF